MHEGELVSARQAAQILGCHRDSVYRLIKDGHLQAFRLGGERSAIKIRRADLGKALVAAATK